VSAYATKNHSTHVYMGQSYKLTIHILHSLFVCQLSRRHLEGDLKYDCFGALVMEIIIKYHGIKKNSAFKYCIVMEFHWIVQEQI